MELLENQLNCIYELISSGEASRNVILDKLTENNPELGKVVELRRAEKDEIEIAKELNTTIEEVRKKIEEIDLINKTIDSTLGKKHVEDSKRKREEELKGQKMHAKTKRSLYLKQIRDFLGKYMKAKEEGNMKKMRLEINADKFAKRVEFLGERLSYKLFLAEMYSYIGRFKEAREILSWYDKDNLTGMERKQYENIEKGILIEENRKMIERLCEKGKSYQEILEECEKVGTSNRVMMNSKFIREVINEYKKEQMEKEQVKAKQAKTEQVKKESIKQEDEIER